MTKFIIHKPSKSIILPHSLKDQILPNIAQAKEIEVQGKKLLAVKHGVNEAATLHRLGFTQIPSPIQYYYNWPKIKGKFDPFEHQKKMGAFYTLHKKCFNLSTMGVGKTEGSLLGYDFLKQQGIVNKVLIFAPLSCLEKVWGDAIFHSFPQYTYTILHGSSKKRKENLEHDVDIYIANHDAVKVFVNKQEVKNKEGKVIRETYVINPDFKKLLDVDLIIIDEMSVFRNGSTGLFKSLQAIVQPRHRIWGLTGTPTPNAPTDAWALAKIINPDNIDKYFGGFKRRTMMQIGGGPFPKWIPQQNAHHTVRDVLQPAVMFRKEDCIDLPPVTYLDRLCELTSDQLKHYKSMKKDMVMLHDDKEISAVNAADRVIKLRQILCGAIKADADDYISLDCKPRINLVLELIEEAAAKVILVVPYKGILRMLKKEIAKHYTIEIVNGDVPPKERNRIFTDFQEAKNPRVLAVHPEVVSHGLTFTAANYLIFYSPIDSSDQYLQVCERMPRPGQVNNMSVIHIFANSLEQKIYEGLKERKSFQSMALDLYKEEIAK